MGPAANTRTLPPTKNFLAQIFLPQKIFLEIFHCKSHTVSMPDPAVPVVTQLLPARTATGVNWVGAFVLYVKGSSYQEISEQFAIPLTKLLAKARGEDWEGMMKNLPAFQLKAPAAAICPVSAEDVGRMEKEIKSNRRQALKVSHGLRGHVVKILEDYEKGKKTLTPDEISKLARASAQIDAAAMLALGDDPAPKLPPPPPPAPSESQQSGNGRDRAVTHYHLNFPSIISEPRNVTERQDGPKGELIPGVKDPTMILPRVILEPEKVVSEIIEDVKSGRSSIDFSQLGKVVKSVPPPAPAVKVPEAFR